MLNLKTGIKASLLSALIFVGSVATTAQADHDHSSVLPYVAAGVFATMLYRNNHTHTYRYEKKHYHGHHKHGGHYGSHRRYRHNNHGHNHGHSQSYSYSNEGYQNTSKRKNRH